MQSRFLDHGNEFSLEEYRYHAQKIGKLQDTRFTYIKFSLAGTGALFAYLLSPTSGIQSSPHFYVLIWFPVILNVFGLMLVFGVRDSILRHASYLMELEKRFLGSEGGWEHFIRNRPESTKQSVGHKKLNKLPITVVNYSFWILMIIITTAFATYICFF